MLSLVSAPQVLTATLAAALLALLPSATHADASVPGISEGFRFSQQDGESLYRAVCQSCHMADGQGAQGAGMYPALANNAKLGAPLYPAYTVLKGRKGMPAFGAAPAAGAGPGGVMLTDEQIALVTNYVRSNFGNRFPGTVTAAEVKALR